MLSSKQQLTMACEGLLSWRIPYILGSLLISKKWFGKRKVAIFSMMVGFIEGGEVYWIFLFLLQEV